jgi:hypothetical protein
MFSIVNMIPPSGGSIEAVNDLAAQSKASWGLLA